MTTAPISIENSTIGRLRPIPVPSPIRLGLRLGGAFAPGWAAGAARRLFFTPPPLGVRPEQAAVLARGRRLDLVEARRPLGRMDLGNGRAGAAAPRLGRPRRPAHAASSRPWSSGSSASWRWISRRTASRPETGRRSATSRRRSWMRPRPSAPSLVSSRTAWAARRRPWPWTAAWSPARPSSWRRRAGSTPSSSASRPPSASANASAGGCSGARRTGSAGASTKSSPGVWRTTRTRPCSSCTTAATTKSCSTRAPSSPAAGPAPSCARPTASATTASCATPKRSAPASTSSPATPEAAPEPRDPKADSVPDQRPKTSSDGGWGRGRRFACRSPLLRPRPPLPWTDLESADWRGSGFPEGTPWPAGCPLETPSVRTGACRPWRGLRRGHPGLLGVPWRRLRCAESPAA